jgi:hypothetical protein
MGQAVMILERVGQFVGIKKMENIPSCWLTSGGIDAET